MKSTRKVINSAHIVLRKIKGDPANGYVVERSEVPQIVAVADQISEARANRLMAGQFNVLALDEGRDILGKNWLGDRVRVNVVKPVTAETV